MRLKDISSVLCVFAHQDDAESSYGGTIARLVGMGAEVRYLVCTDGSRGGWDPKMPEAELAGIRAAEQREAAAALGVKEVDFLGYRNGTLEITPDLRRDIVRRIRKFRPEVVITHPPRRLFHAPIGVSHAEHIAVGEATFEAVYPEARSVRSYPELLVDEGLKPHTVREVWLPAFKKRDSDLYIDVDAEIDKKIAAIKCFHSQMERPGRVPWDFRLDLEPRMVKAGQHVGSSYAEAFTVVATAPRRGFKESEGG